MKTQRLQLLHAAAKEVRARLRVREAQWAARLEVLGGPVAYQWPPYAAIWNPGHTNHGRPLAKPIYAEMQNGRADQILRAKAVNASSLPEVSPAEHHELIHEGHTRLAGLTRLRNQDHWIDSSPMQESKPARVREIRIGERQLGVLPSAGEDLAGVIAETEDEQEITDLITLTYQDPPAFERWMKIEVTRLCHKAKVSPKNPGFRQRARRILLEDLPTCGGEPLMCMIEDEHTGEYRPLRIGDTVSIVIGANADLDALFMDEIGDPSQPSELEGDTSKHLWAEQFRSNTYTEEEFLHGSCFSTPHWNRILLRKDEDGRLFTTRTDSYRMANTAMGDLRYELDDLTIRRLARRAAARALRQSGDVGAFGVEELVDMAERHIREELADVRFQPGLDGMELTQGYFVSKSEYFAELDARWHEWLKEAARAKARPPRLEWDRIREPHQNRKRFLEQERNRMRAQLVPPPVGHTGHHR